MSNGNPGPAAAVKYHSQAFKLLGRPPRLRANASEIAAELDGIEEDFALRIPASIREWYLLEWPAEVEHFSTLQPFDELVDDDDPSFPFAARLMLVRDDSEHGDRYAVPMDGTDNPPVYERHPDLPQWTRYSDSYSDLIAVDVWERIVFDGVGDVRTTGEFAETPNAWLGALKTSSHTAPVTYGLAEQHRVHSDGWAVRLDISPVYGVRCHAWFRSLPEFTDFFSHHVAALKAARWQMDPELMTAVNARGLSGLDMHC